MFVVDESRYGYVYRTTHIATGHTYVGMHRIKQGEAFDAYLGSGRKIANAIRKHGRKSFAKEVLCYADSRTALVELEIAAILAEQENGGAQYNLYLAENTVDKMVSLTGVTADDMFRMYFDEEKSTRSIAEALGVSQPTIVRFITLLKSEDDRFSTISERMIRKSRTLSKEEIAKRQTTLRAQGKKICPQCGNEFAAQVFNRHASACGTMPRCEVCNKELRKRTAKRCTEHKIHSHGKADLSKRASTADRRRGGMKTAHIRWHVKRDITVDTCELCVNSE